MAKKETFYVVFDVESGALEYGPAPDKDAAVAHKDKLVAMDVRGSLAEGVGRKLEVFELKAL